MLELKILYCLVDNRFVNYFVCIYCMVALFCKFLVYDDDGCCLVAGFAFATDALGELHVLRHDGHTLGVDGAAVGVFVETDQISLGGFLEGEDGLRLEAEVLLVLPGDLADETLEGGLADQEIRRLLVFADLAKSDGTRAEAVLLGGAGAADNTGLGGQGLARGLATGDDLACGLLSASHVCS